MRRPIKPPKPLPVKVASSSAKSKGHFYPSHEVLVSWFLFVLSSAAWLGASKLLLRSDHQPVTVLLAKTALTLVLLLGQSLFWGNELAPLNTEELMWWQGIAALHTCARLLLLVVLSLCSLPLFCALSCLCVLGHGLRAEESSPGNVVLGAVVLAGVVLFGAQNASRLSGGGFAAVGLAVICVWLLLFIQRRAATAMDATSSATAEFYVSVGSFPILVGLYAWSSTGHGFFSFFAVAPWSDISGTGKLLVLLVVILENVKVWQQQMGSSS